jgi:hypothetical protein
MLLIKKYKVCIHHLLQWVSGSQGLGRRYSASSWCQFSWYFGNKPNTRIVSLLISAYVKSAQWNKAHVCYNKIFPVVFYNLLPWLAFCHHHDNQRFYERGNQIDITNIFLIQRCLSLEASFCLLVLCSWHLMMLSICQ